MLTPTAGPDTPALHSRLPSSSVYRDLSELGQDQCHRSRSSPILIGPRRGSGSGGGVEGSRGQSPPPLIHTKGRFLVGVSWSAPTFPCDTCQSLQTQLFWLHGQSVLASVFFSQPSETNFYCVSLIQLNQLQAPSLQVFVSL